MDGEEEVTRLPLETEEDQTEEPRLAPVEPEQNGDVADGPMENERLQPDDTQESSRPESKGPKMPSLETRPALARTPSHLLSPTQEPPHDEGDEEAGVLITELQLQEEAEDRGSDVTPEEQEGEVVTIETVDAKTMDEEYDTDLEDEIEEEKDRLKSYYHKVCDQLNIVPVSYFLRHMRDPNLTMRFHGLGGSATMAIALALRDSIDVERLDIEGNWIMAEGGRAISKLLEENEYITEVGLAENKLGNEGAEHVCRMLQVNGGLRKFGLRGNEFDDKAAPFFAEALENNKYLRELDLSHNKFSEAGAEVLGPAIASNENLDVLDLSWNHLRPRGGVAIARGLKENVRLKVLNLAWNGLGEEGGAAIADALTVNQALLELDLTGNRLGLDTAKKVAKVLVTNDSLKVLKMGNNLITSGGAIALITAVNNTDNCELEELDLTDIEVEYEFLRVLEDTKMKRPNFKCKHGPVMRAGNTLDDLGKPGIDPFKKKKDPVVILQEHIVVNDMRLVDILKRYDPDGALSVTPKDFLNALEELAVPFDKSKLEEAVHRLAENQSGRIYFGDFVSQDTPRPEGVDQQVQS